MDRVINKYPLIILVLIWFIFIVWPIGNRGLWAPDEPRYLQVAWEMSRTESYLIPVMNAEIYSEKPPLFFWLTILASKLTSFENASRWVSALASLGILLLTYSLGRISGNKNIGFTATVILMTSSLFTLLMYTGNMDTTLTFLTTLSLFFFIKWDLKGKLQYLVFAYTACGIGILAKGPVALLIPWLTYIIWEIIKRYKHEKTSFLHLLWGPLLALAIAAVWVVPACIAGGKEYTQIILLKQQVGRALQSYVHQRPWYQYFLIFPPNVLPWFVVLFGAIPEIKKLLKDKNRSILLYVVWFCTIFIFFSLISSKRERYLLPCFPVFSLLLSHAIAGWTERKEPSNSLRIVGLMILIGLSGFLTFPLILPFLKTSFPVLNIFRFSAGDWRLWSLFGLGIGAAVSIWHGFKLVKEKRHLKACNVFALALLVMAAIGQIYYIPYIDPVKSAKKASETIEKLLPQEGSIAFYRRRYDNGWNFYLDRAKIGIVTDEQIKQKQPNYDLLILRQKHMPLLKAVLNMDNYRIAAVEPVGSKQFVLLKHK